MNWSRGSVSADAGFTEQATWDLSRVPLLALFIASGVLLAAGFSLAIALLFQS